MGYRQTIKRVYPPSERKNPNQKMGLVLDVEIEENNIKTALIVAEDRSVYGYLCYLNGVDQNKDQTIIKVSPIIDTNEEIFKPGLCEEIKKSRLCLLFPDTFMEGYELKVSNKFITIGRNLNGLQPFNVFKEMVDNQLYLIFQYQSNKDNRTIETAPFKITFITETPYRHSKFQPKPDDSTWIYNGLEVMFDLFLLYAHKNRKRSTCTIQ